MTVAIVFGSIFAYLVMIAATGATLDAKTYMARDDCYFLGVVWPPVWAVAFGKWLSRVTINALDRDARRRAKVAHRRRYELDEANHKAEIARIEENTIKMLEEANSR